MRGPGAAALPAPPRQRAFAPPLAGLWLRPWFDWVGLRFVTRFWFPLSRAWAAAEASDGDPERFRAETGFPGPLDALEGPLAAVRRAAALHAAASDRWRSIVFDRLPASDEAAIAAELARASAAHRFMAARRPFDRWRRHFPKARWAVAGEAAVAARHGARLADPGRAYPPPLPTEVESSRLLPSGLGQEGWLATSSPVLADRATARLYQPARPTEATPTLIWLHGIAMEPEMWTAAYDPVNLLSRAGWRVLRPEGPWHGRRRPHGLYGGEAVVAGGVESFLTLFQAWVAELGVWIDWARRQGGPVALGGISLGALTAQLYASVAAGWPARLAPDALLLVASGARLRRIAYEGALAEGLGLPRRLREAGWSEAGLERWLTLIEPGPPALSPDRILLQLGSADSVTPYDAGCALAADWRLPRRNLFVAWRGHFSSALSLGCDPRPLRRLAAVLDLPDPLPRL